MRIVLDTNIFISAFLSKHGTPRQALEFAARNTILLFSPETREELHTKILSKKFDSRGSVENRERFTKALFTIGTMIVPSNTFDACRDKRDNKFLDLTVAGRADYLVSGDKDLLVLNPFQGIPILNAVDFLKAVNTENA